MAVVKDPISLVGGPTLTLGTFSKPFLDYTQLSIVGSGSPSKMATALSISTKPSTWAPLALASPNRSLGRSS